MLEKIPPELQAFGVSYACKHALALQWPRVRERVREVSPSEAHNIEAAFYVCRHAMTREQPAVLVVLRDTSSPACPLTITNGAELICQAIYENYLKSFKLDWEHIRWIYRDSLGQWDEIVADCGPLAPVATVDFRPLGGAKSLDEALAHMSHQASKVMP
jgi:hypothetical protein